MVVNEAVEWDFDRAKDTYHRWRTANPHRPFKVYHLKLIFYLLLQLIEWPADVILAVWLFKADHHNTGRATAVMTVAPQLVIAFFIVLNMETFKSARTWQKPFILLGLLPVRFLAYLVMDVLITLYVFFVELVYFCIGFLPHLGPSKNRFARMPDQRRRQFIFFRGIYEFWFESLPQFVIRLVVALRGGVIQRELLWIATFVAAVNALVHGIKAIRFRSETKLRVFKPAFHAVRDGTTQRQGRKVIASPKVKVMCTLENFPWVDFYNDVYEEMYVERVPNMGLSYFRYVCRLASRTYALRKIEAINCEISDAGPLSISYLTEAMRNNHGMAEINISMNNLGNEGAGHIADMLRNNSTLEILNLSKNKIEVEGIRFIAGALRAHNTYLKTLIVDHNVLGKEGGESLGQLLRFNFTLEQLSLAGCGIGDCGVEKLSAGLSTNTTLFILNLDDNSIGPEGATKLGEHLAHNATLQKMTLSNNQIGNEGTERICLALDENFSMEELSLKNTGITENGPQHIGQMLTVNNMLQCLNLGENRIGDEGIDHILKGLGMNKFLKELVLESSAIGDNGAVALGQFLQGNPVLTKLNLWGNGDIGDTGAAALGKALESNTILQELRFEWKQSGVNTDALIANGVNENRAQNGQLQHLEVHVTVAAAPPPVDQKTGNENGLGMERRVYTRHFSAPTVDDVSAEVQIDMAELSAQGLSNTFYCFTEKIEDS